ALALQAGQLVQDDTPLAMYQQPRTPYVAHLLGDANVFEIRQVPQLAVASTSARWACIRPECIHLSTPAKAQVWGQVRAWEYLGAYYRMEVEILPGLHWWVRSSSDRIRRDKTVYLRVKPEDIHFLED
ncbi:MAG: TOBE domain-containing protein, partial [Bacteroidia bacterium]|nr:TOBE domain-containing protein [Bacteroidia bacterium]